MKTFACLSAPQFAGFVKRTGCNLVSELNKKQLQQRTAHFKLEVSDAHISVLLNSLLPIWVVECNCIHHISVTL